MFFFMCKSKKTMSRKVTSPTPRSSPSLRKSQHHSSSSNPYDSTGSDNFIIPSTASTSSFYRNSHGSLNSTRASLSGLRESISREQPHIYDFQEIIAATNNFLIKPHSKSSSSTAWRCTVRDQLCLIFQRRTRRQMDTAQIVDRLAVICRSHHSSLVKLKGASISGAYIYLVYDYIPGANLADCLRNARNPNFTVLSNWMSRMRVASDIAHGLDYVHNSTGLGFEFVHNHIKSSSVIVVEPSLNAKLCHFGTSELCGEIIREECSVDSNRELKRSSSKVNKLEGTRGYMAPEFQKSGIVTQKCDVYAFGVVILELLSGMEALAYKIDEESGSYARISVVETAREAVKEGGVRKWVDRRLRDSYPVAVVEKLARLALDCVEDDPDNRPDMGRVAVRVSQMFLESQDWAGNMGSVTDFTVTLGPR
ncbi:Protein kinase superfamily protein [Striga hermonthica]|uniref:Protein kinase superfamily protein n=1 Tax=Striga hermonthica TaxID=68872 RepID=A0A9N7MRV9_STRHE|nr:Protein kinase superfamily protein [Striga hermonthica]